MKIVCVPLSREAMLRLDFDSCVEGELLEFIIDDSDFNEIFNAGFFANINSYLGLMIDEYEDESIPFEKLEDAISVFCFFLDEKGLRNESFYKIGELLKLAKEKKTGFFMYF